MKRFHVAYYIYKENYPMLSGVTYEANNITEAIAQYEFEHGAKGMENIKYVAEL